MEECGLEVVDIENLRRHYALTLDAWAERFDANWETIHALDPQRFDERFRRIWRTLSRRLRRDVPLAGRPHAPLPDRLPQGQRDPADYPMSRAFLYERRGEGCRALGSAAPASGMA